MKKIYLAGPEVFLPDAEDIFEKRKKISLSYGYLAVTPFDNSLDSEIKGIERARKIFEANKNLILNSDYIIANCNPFRSAIVDDGTSFEIGFGFANKKKIYGFCSKKISLPEIVKNKIQTKPHESGYEIDNDGYLVNEDFGNTINLMLEFSILESGGKLIEGSYEDAIKELAESSS
ncbi:MAG: nucleoside 2-deoxyribosyltransferase [Leptospiraceae bacterium]|nr:nucleoside 2-deoxyribosyltransferase [Leptospiraceae bacterium]